MARSYTRIADGYCSKLLILRSVRVLANNKGEYIWHVDLTPDGSKVEARLATAFFGDHRELLPSSDAQDRTPVRQRNNEEGAQIGDFS
jgi:hypothetical protein